MRFPTTISWVLGATPLFLVACGGGPPPPPPAPPPPPRVELDVRFTTLEVVDDKESGSGDWRVTLLVDGQPLDEPVTGEADSGGSVKLDRTAHSGGLEAEHKLVLTVKVEEHDGGFDNTWEMIGETTESYDKAAGFGLGGQVFELDNDEGHVRVHCVITRNAPAAPGIP